MKADDYGHIDPEKIDYWINGLSNPGLFSMTNEDTLRLLLSYKSVRNDLSNLEVEVDKVYRVFQSLRADERFQGLIKEVECADVL